MARIDFPAAYIILLIHNHSIHLCSGEAEGGLGAELHGGGVEGTLQLVRVVLGPDQQAVQAAQAAHKVVLRHSTPA